MKHTHKGNFASKHDPQAAPDAVLAEAVKKATNNGLPCAVAFSLAERLKVSPLEVGRTADLLEVSLTKCQLGLFGYQPEKRIVKPASEVSEEMRSLIEAGMVNDRLPCKTAWEIAERLGVSRMAVSSACERLSVKVKPCQLGSF